tara:strand:- start:390 stop:530 length:141 start_codon:yes stop_codon:yes gene_type:complete
VGVVLEVVHKEAARKEALRVRLMEAVAASVVEVTVEEAWMVERMVA